MWNYEGMWIKATYMDTFEVTGVVHLSRVTFDGRVAHHMALDTPMEVYGRLAESVIVDHSSIEMVRDRNFDREVINT